MFNGEALEEQPCGESCNYSPGECWRQSGCGVISGTPNLCVWEPAAAGTGCTCPPKPGSAAAGGMGVMQHVGQQWGAILLLRKRRAKSVSRSQPNTSTGTRHRLYVHALTAPALTAVHCCGQVSAWGQHIKDTALFLTPSLLPKTSPGTLHLHQSRALSVLPPFPSLTTNSFLHLRGREASCPTCGQRGGMVGVKTGFVRPSVRPSVLRQPCSGR